MTTSSQPGLFRFSHSSTTQVGIVLWLLLCPVIAGAAEVEDPVPPEGGVTFLQPPEGAKVISLSLAVSESSGPRPQGYLAQRSPQPLDELAAAPPALAQAQAGKEAYIYQIAALTDGTRFLVVLNRAADIKFLNRNESALWHARIYRVPAGKNAKPELLREGYQSSGGDVTVPFDIPLPGIGATKVRTFHTELGYSLSGTQDGKPQVYSGRGQALQVSGSYAVPEGKLTLTVTMPDQLTVTPDTQVTLRFEPAEAGLAEHVASGKLTDYLTLGSARLVVSAVAPDFSSAKLAVVAGSLAETLKQQLQVGTQMPPFAQLDLLTRKTVTQEELLVRARTSSGVVFVFGDLAPAIGRGGPYPLPYRPGGNAALPLPPGEVAEQLGLQLQPKPLAVLVTRQVGLDFLYQDLRNKTPDYVLLSDFADPLRTMFRLPQSTPGAWYGPSFSGSPEPSLRQLFNLPANTVSIAAFNAQGKVVYVNADTGGGFLPALAAARTALGNEDRSGK